jgi:hypothetical protein
LTTERRLVSPRFSEECAVAGPPRDCCDHRERHVEWHHQRVSRRCNLPRYWQPI